MVRHCESTLSLTEAWYRLGRNCSDTKRRYASIITGSRPEVWSKTNSGLHMMKFYRLLGKATNGPGRFFNDGRNWRKAGGCMLLTFDISKHVDLFGTFHRRIPVTHPATKYLYASRLLYAFSAFPVKYKDSRIQGFKELLLSYRFTLTC